MSIRLREREFELAFSGPAVASGHVPASTLSQTLRGFQRAAALIAAEQEQQEARQQESALAGWSWHHTVFCSGSNLGEPVFFASVGDPMADPAAEKHIQTVAEKFAEIIQALVNGDEKALELAMPDVLRRRRVLRALLGALPHSGTGVETKFRRRGSELSFSGATLGVRLEKALAKTAPGEQAPQIINGELVSINFRKRRLLLKMANLNIDVDCECPPDILELIEGFQSRELIQVFGRFVPAREATDPDRMEDIRDIRPLDLSPIHLSEVERGSRCLVLDPPATLFPKLDKAGREIRVEWPAIELRAAADTRSRLIESVEKKLHALWGRYSRLQTGGETPTPEEADRARRVLRLMDMRPAGWRAAAKPEKPSAASMEMKAVVDEVFETAPEDEDDMDAQVRDVFDLDPDLDEV
jgi:hypothetical protein